MSQGQNKFSTEDKERGFDSAFRANLATVERILKKHRWAPSAYFLIKVPGSPIVFQNAAASYPELNAFLFAIDKDEGAIAALRGRLNGGNAHTFIGDNSELVNIIPDLLRKFGADPENSFGTILIDPNSQRSPKITKFPQRFSELGELPKNAWMGTTVDCQDRVDNAEKAFAKVRHGTKWLSVEPMLTPLRFKNLDLFDWIVIGGSSQSSKTPAWTPPVDWIVDLHLQAREAGCRIYYKTNAGMSDDLRIQEFPWGSKPVEKKLPKELRYLGMKK